VRNKPTLKKAEGHKALINTQTKRYDAGHISISEENRLSTRELTSNPTSNSESKQFLEATFPQPTPKKTNRKRSSKTNVYPSRSHGVGVWNNSREVISFRGDTGLYSTFKPIAKARFGSTCRAFESFMAAIVACENTGVNFGNTVKIDSLHIERNLRPRRKLESVEVNETISHGFSDSECFKCKRSNVLLSKAKFDSGIVAMACPECLEDYQQKRMVKHVFGEIPLERG